ncbi:hypothetical protein [Chryseobacterium sp.]|uniref:hypothetical protein n=1 Tax=Chryseobacterium sp. TaxID=1871047 RepID=UPI00289EF7DC|nr:hypothetical protein [Chryseobacterium sp.]
MKNFIPAILSLSVLGFLACSKKTDASALPTTTDESRATYDTTAIDSFSNGAVSVDVARQIRMSSKQYQDSLREVIRLQEQEKKINEELEKEEKKKKEDEKKNAEKEKKAADEKPKTE